MKEINKKIPKCIGIIMDGNRRWAKMRGLTSYKGHSAGCKKLKEFISWSNVIGVKNIVTYAFSTENWKRSDIEIEYLFKIFKKFILEEFDFLKKENVKVRCIGQIDKFSKDLQDGIKNLERKTEKNDGVNVYLALSYGGRAEILHAVSELLEKSKKDDVKIIESEFAKYLWTKDMSDPDLIIRTGGEMRLSNFLLWQSAYSELFFTNTHWPDFSEEEFLKIISDFQRREKRFGK
ncbi:MAG: polyprenyl diphosphate synthase [Patescibacteria group bacterium]